MKIRFELFFLALLGLVFSGSGLEVTGQENSLISFSLEDQFDVSHIHTQYAGFYVIVVGGDRKGSDYCFNWSDAIKEKLELDTLKNRIKILGIADLQTAPSSFQSFIKKKFPREKDQWVALDWKGIFANAYHFRQEMANIIIFRPDGTRIYTLSATEVNLFQLDNFISIIRSDAVTEK